VCALSHPRNLASQMPTVDAWITGASGATVRASPIDSTSPDAPGKPPVSPVLSSFSGEIPRWTTPESEGSGEESRDPSRARAHVSASSRTPESRTLRIKLDQRDDSIADADSSRPSSPPGKPQRKRRAPEANATRSVCVRSVKQRPVLAVPPPASATTTSTVAPLWAAGVRRSGLQQTLTSILASFTSDEIVGTEPEELASLASQLTSVQHALHAEMTTFCLEEAAWTAVEHAACACKGELERHGLEASLEDVAEMAEGPSDDQPAPSWQELSPHMQAVHILSSLSSSPPSASPPSA
jgi:hypothetical protein